MTTAISCAMFTLNQGRIDLFLLKFLSNGHALICTQPIAMSVYIFHHAQAAGNNQHATGIFCAFVQGILGIFQALNDNDEQFHEKLAVMIINGNLDLGVDLSTVASEFLAQNIVWALIDVITPNQETWISYHTFANHTGGKYMFIANASRILPQIISSVVTGEDTLGQAFVLII